MTAEPRILAGAYWVSPGELMAGPRPGHADPGVQRERLGRLVDAGIRTVVDLTTPADGADLRVPWLRRAPAGVELGWVRVPLSDGGTPDVAWMQLVLDLVDASIGRGRPVYVHCLGGLGRTGTVAACWLIRHGRCAPDAVIDRLSELRAGQPTAHRPSPETPGQRAFVRAWVPGA